MKKFLKWLLIGLVGIILLGILVVRLFVHEPRPEIVDGDADALAQKILSAVNKPAWDTLPYAKWTFTGVHHYVWDKTTDKAIISWDDNEVHLNTKSVTGIALAEGSTLNGEEADKLVQEAWGYWCNDMWWFAAPFKVMDPGTTRQLAKDKDGQQGLLVSYGSGGVTPGDAYLWYTDDTGLPTGYKMWVDIIPVGGLYSPWTGWKTLEGGAKVAPDHTLELLGLPIAITDVAAGDSWSDLGYDANPIKL